MTILWRFNRKKGDEKMNTSTKCNCCVKNDVCKFVKEYEDTCEEIKKVADGNVAEYSVKCKYMSAMSSIR